MAKRLDQSIRKPLPPASQKHTDKKKKLKVDKVGRGNKHKGKDNE